MEVRPHRPYAQCREQASAGRSRPTGARGGTVSPLRGSPPAAPVRPPVPTSLARGRRPGRAVGRPDRRGHPPPGGPDPDAGSGHGDAAHLGGPCLRRPQPDARGVRRRGGRHRPRGPDDLERGPLGRLHAPHPDRLHRRLQHLRYESTGGARPRSGPAPSGSICTCRTGRLPGRSTSTSSDRKNRGKRLARPTVGRITPSSRPWSLSAPSSSPRRTL